MAEIRITLKSDLCAASGAGSGNAIDTDVVLDSQGIPYIPARRIKGCLRQSADDLRKWGCEAASLEKTEKLFGNRFGQAGALTVESAYLPHLKEIRAAIDKAAKNPELKGFTSPARVADLFTYVRGSTAMEDGKALDGSLRFTRVTDRYSRLSPDTETVFVCKVFLADPEAEELLRLCCQATRHIGHNRNRGLGEVSMTYVPDTEGPAEQATAQASEASERCLVEYRILLREPMRISGLDDRLAAISARAVIGCLAGEWLKQHSADEPAFRRLFLSGETQWQDMTPVTEGKRSVPAPRMLARLKGEQSRLVNLLGDLTEEERRGKKKALDGSFAVIREDGFDLLSVSVSSMYHHSTEKEDMQATLYVEESLDAGCVYGGAVTVPGDLVGEVCSLLQRADFRFGRSKSAQYGACSLLGAPVVEPLHGQVQDTKDGETVYALLLSDLCLSASGLQTPEDNDVRMAIAEKTGLKDQRPVDPKTGAPLADSCSYRQLSGYHAMWQLHKPVITLVSAGSYYQLIATGAPIPREIRLGGFPQEGMGRILLIPKHEMDQMIHLRELAPDAGKESAEAYAPMEIALLSAAAADRLEARALDYVKQHPRLKNDVQIGRLRLMLAEAKDPADLLRRVESIKTEKYRKKSLQLLKDLYSAGIDVSGDLAQSNNTKVDLQLSSMLCGEDGLLKLLEDNPQAGARVLADWKRLLSKVLSLSYYQEVK